QREVDRHVGRVLDALESRPRVAANTVIVFTSDHGEYGASHGLRGKGAGAYEEAIRVPLIVKDPRGVLTSETERARTHLSSSVAVAPLLLPIATGSDDWRREPPYSHLSGRLDLAAILADSKAPGRPYVLHATDETVTEFAIEPYAAGAPRHVLALRTPTAKYATYSNWADGGIAPLAEGQEAELYDYGTHGGRLELNNSAGHSPLEESLRARLERALHDELRAPLPYRLTEARARGFADYVSVARSAARSAAAHRRHRLELEVGRLDGDGAEPPPGRRRPPQTRARPGGRRPRSRGPVPPRGGGPSPLAARSRSQSPSSAWRRPARGCSAPLPSAPARRRRPSPHSSWQ